MRTLIVNLKHFYQCRGLWIFFIWLALCDCLKIYITLRFSFHKPDIIDLVANELLAFSVYSPFGIGFVSGGMVLAVMREPFAFCLPGHIKTVRRLLFLIGLFVSFIGACLFTAHLLLAYPWISFWQKMILVYPAFCACFLMFWFVAGLCFVDLFVAVIVGIVFTGLLAGSMLFGLNIILGYVLIGYPEVIVGIGVLGSIFMWFLLISEGIARWCYSDKWIGIFGIWDRLKQNRDRQIGASVESGRYSVFISRWIDRFFLDRMRRNSFSGKGRYIWGQFYIIYTKFMPLWKLPVLGVGLVALLSLCYLEQEWHMILFMFLIFMPLEIDLPVSSSMLISGGRNERLLTSIVLVVVYVIFVAVFITSFIGLSMLLASVMPGITLFGRTFIFHSISLKSFDILSMNLYIIPVIFTGKLAFHGKPIQFMIFIVSSLIPMSVLYFEVGMLMGGIFKINVLTQLIEGIGPHYLTTFLTIALTVLGWFGFFAVLYYVCMKRPLVGQSEANWPGVAKI